MQLQNERILSVKNIPAISIAIFGILVAFIGLIMSIIEMAHGVKCSHGEAMGYCKSSLINKSTNAYSHMLNMSKTSPIPIS